MKFERYCCRDDVLFVLALLVPSLIAGARFFESALEMDQIAQIHQRSTMVASTHRPPADARIAIAKADAR